jgi:NTP pyrophosphatase (non-canonical NTP hydrolase)
VVRDAGLPRQILGGSAFFSVQHGQNIGCTGDGAITVHANVYASRMSPLRVASLNGSSRPSTGCDSLRGIERQLRTFRQERNWERFHTPKNLAISVAIEVGELLEHFQWRSDAEITQHLASDKEHVADEIADVAIYAIQLADVAGIDLGAAIATKIAKNDSKYPAELAHSSDNRRIGD